MKVKTTGIIIIIFCCIGSTWVGDNQVCRTMEPPMMIGVM